MSAISIGYEQRAATPEDDSVDAHISFKEEFVFLIIINMRGFMYMFKKNLKKSNFLPITC